MFKVNKQNNLHILYYGWTTVVGGANVSYTNLGTRRSSLPQRIP